MGISSTFSDFHNNLAALIQVGLFYIALIRPKNDDGVHEPGLMSSLRSPLIFCLYVAVVMIVGRWPWLNIARELNPDEGLWLAAALRFSKDIVPWRAAITDTSGPLTPWLLTLIGYLGAPLNYVTAHFVAIGLQIVTICLAYGTLRIVFSEIPARLATMPVALLLSRTGDPEFIHLSSENVPIALMAGCAFSAAQALKVSKLNGKAKGWFFIAGSFAGSVGFAKLQAGPMTLVMAIFIVIMIIKLPDSLKIRMLKLLCFISGLCTVPAIVVGIVLLGNAWIDMWNLYFFENLAYIDSAPTKISYFVRVQNLIFGSRLFSLLFKTVGGLVIVAFCVRLLLSNLSVEAKYWRILLASLVFLMASFFCVAKPDRDFPHYLLLLLLPSILLSGALLQLILSGHPTKVWRVVGTVVVCIAPLSALSEGLFNGVGVLDVDKVWYRLNPIRQAPIKPETKIVSTLAKQNDECAVWGWRPDIYIDGCPRPALRNVAPDIAAPGPFGDYRRWHFLEDLRKKRPRIFVDAVCFSGSPEIGWYTTGPAMEEKLEGYKPFLPLQEFVANHYVQTAQVPCNPGDRLSQILLQNHRVSFVLKGIIRIFELHNSN